MRNKKKTFYDIISNMVVENINSQKHKTDIYRALCNIKWINKNTNEVVTISWRSAGSIISEAEGNYDTYNYLNYYCSGNEGNVEKWVKKYLAKHGWKPQKYQNDSFYNNNVNIFEE